MISDADGKETATLEELEAAVQSTYHAVVEAALAGHEQASAGATRRD